RGAAQVAEDGQEHRGGHCSSGAVTRERVEEALLAMQDAAALRAKPSASEAKRLLAAKGTEGNMLARRAGDFSKARNVGCRPAVGFYSGITMVLDGGPVVDAAGGAAVARPMKSQSQEAVFEQLEDARSEFAAACERACMVEAKAARLGKDLAEPHDDIDLMQREFVDTKVIANTKVTATDADLAMNDGLFRKIREPSAELQTALEAERAKVKQQAAGADLATLLAQDTTAAPGYEVRGERGPEQWRQGRAAPQVVPEVLRDSLEAPRVASGVSSKCKWSVGAAIVAARVDDVFCATHLRGHVRSPARAPVSGCSPCSTFVGIEDRPLFNVRLGICAAAEVAILCVTSE
ncbi:unnamed protein product, partial [Prorocentrum cordatum]